MLQHDDGIDGDLFAGRIHIRFQRNGLAAAQPLVGGDDDAGSAVLDPSGQRFGRKTAEHDRMDRPDARAGEHGDGGFRHHRQGNRDPVAFFDALVFQRVGKPADFGMQIAVGQRAGCGIGAVRFPVDGHLVAARFKMPVQRVGTDVERAAFEPADVEIVLVERGILNLLERVHPIDALRFFAPEAVRVLDRPAIPLFVAFCADQGVVGPSLGYGVGAGFAQCLSPRPFEAGIGNARSAGQRFVRPRPELPGPSRSHWPAGTAWKGRRRGGTSRSHRRGRIVRNGK